MSLKKIRIKFQMIFIFCMCGCHFLVSDFHAIDFYKQFYQSKRYYDSHLSQFVQADPIIPEANAIGLNRYAYVNHDPIQFADPSGHVPQDVFDEIQKGFDSFSESGHNFLLKVDQALYQGINILGNTVALPDPNLDPFGFAFGMIQFNLQPQANRAASKIHKTFKEAAPELLGEPLRLNQVYGIEYPLIRNEMDGFDYILQKHQPLQRLSLRDTSRLRAARSEAKRSVSLLTLMRSQEEYEGALEEAVRHAHTREMDSIQNDLRNVNNLSARLGRMVAYYYYNLDAKADLIGSVFLFTDHNLQNIAVYDHNVVREVQEGWISGGPSFKVAVGPLAIDTQSQTATRTADFFFATEGQFEVFRLRINERFSGQDYNRVIRNPHLFDPPDRSELLSAYGGY